MSKPLDAVPFATTLQVRDSCLCLHVQQAARALARRFDDALRPLNLTSGQFSLLMALNRPTPPSVGMVADTLALDRTTLTANLKPLVRRGLAEVAVDPDDRRGRRVSLTDAGMALLVRAVPIWERTHGAVEDLLDPGGADALRAGLARLSRQDG